jgi:hypothetical protein
MGLACTTPASPETVFVAIDSGTVRAVLPKGAALAQGQLEETVGRAWLDVRVVGGQTDQSVVGRYERDGEWLIFTPRFRVLPGTTWEATWQPPDQAPSVVILETATEALPPQARLLRLEPEVDRVPANLLKLTLSFSEAMRGGMTLTDHIHLVDGETGVVDEHAWYRNELWGPERKRLTLLLHPGRTKTGISYNRDFGPVLREGHAYRVDVTTGLLDLANQPLAEGFSWSFSVGPPDYGRPVPEHWVLEAPVGGSGVLVLGLDEPMDGWLLETAFAVEHAEKGPVAGAWSVARDAMSVRFEPSRDWAPGPYVLSQVGRVEDRAGNTPGRVFDGPADTVKRIGVIQDSWEFVVEGG